MQAHTVLFVYQSMITTVLSDGCVLIFNPRWGIHLFHLTNNEQYRQSNTIKNRSYSLSMHLQNLLPDWQLAERHAQASRIGKAWPKLKNPVLCKCCLNPVEKDPISLGTNVKNLHFLGFGVPLFYHFLQGCIILNLLLIVTDNLPSIISAHAYSIKTCRRYIQRSYSHSSGNSPVTLGILPSSFRNKAVDSQFQKFNDSVRVQCTKLFVYNAQIEREQSPQQRISRICSFLIHACCLVFIKSQILKRKQYYNEIYHQLSDYSVILKELNPEISLKGQKLKQFINYFQQIYLIKFDAQKIIDFPQNKSLQAFLLKRQQLLSQLLQLRETNDSQLDTKWQQFTSIEVAIQQQVKTIKKDNLMGKNRGNYLIVIFERKINKIEFLRRVQQILQDPTFAHLFGNSAGIVIEDCPNPKEIIWTNLKYTCDRPFNVFLGWFLSLLFLSFTFVLFYLLQTYKTHFIREAFFMKPESLGAESRKRSAMALAWATWLGIIFYNKFVMAPVLEYFTKLERHDNVSNEDFSFAFKYALGMFFTSSIMKIVVETTQFNNYYRQDFGIIEEESLMFVFSAVFLPLLWLVHPNRLIHLVKRWVYYGRECVTQEQANELMAEYPYFVGKRYAQIIEMMWFTYLYTQLIPLGGFLMLLGQCMYYWIDKYNLLRRSSLNYTVGVALSDKMLRLLDLTLFWRFLGSFVFDLSLRQQIHPSTMVLLVVSITYAMLPWEYLLDFFDHEEFNVSVVPYSILKNTQFKDNSYEVANSLNNYIESGVFLKRRTSYLSQ